MRPSTACVACRNRRRKCEATKPGEPCVYCKNRNVQCSFTITDHSRKLHEQSQDQDQKQIVWSSKTSPISPVSPSLAEYNYPPPSWPSQATTSAAPTTISNGSSSRLFLPPQPLCEELVRLYFHYIHDTFHSIFHQPSLTEDVRMGVVPRVTLLSIISLSARFSTDPFFTGIDPRVRGRAYAREAERLLDLRDISVHTIQACVLLGAFVITEGEAVSEALYYSVACRLAMVLDLPRMEVSGAIEREVNLRLWWTLMMIDVWCSNGLNLPRSMLSRDGVPYPMEEVVFLNMRRGDATDQSGAWLGGPDSMVDWSHGSAASLLTQMVKLSAILVEISELNQVRVAAVEAASPASAFHFDDSVESLGRKLDNWYANIPSQLKDTPENLAHYASLGLGYFFVAVYLGYYHYGQLLYYQYLHEDSFADEIGDDQNLARHARHYANTCKFYATALCEILYRAYETPGCEVYYTMVGHVLVISSTVQLHILLFSRSDSDIRAARGRLEKNFEILSRLQTFWPTLDVCFTRFSEFHRACMDEKKKESSFRMDRWMLKFLFEFAKPVEEKNDNDELAELVPWKMTDLGFSPYAF